MRRPGDGDQQERPTEVLVLGALSGVVSAAVFLAVAELVALLVAREGSPILAVGSFVIDIVPQPFKEFAIATFGEYDKIALLVGLAPRGPGRLRGRRVCEFLNPPLGVVALVIAGGSRWPRSSPARGRLRSPRSLRSRDGRRMHRPLTFLGRGCVAGRHRPQRTPSDHRLRRRSTVAHVLPRDRDRRCVGDHRGNRRARAQRDDLLDRGGAQGAQASRARTNVDDSGRRRARHPGISPLFTPNDDFYRVDTALTVPSVDPETWRLVIDGMVDERVELTFDDLVGMGLDEYSDHPHLCLERGRRRPARQRDLARCADARRAQLAGVAVGRRHGALAERRRIHRGHAARIAHRRRPRRDPRRRA